MDENRLREDRRVLHNILKGILRCRNDRWFTMMDVDDGFLGYTREEIKERFNNCYIEMIRPDDRERMRRELTEQINRGGEYEVEYRVEDRSGRSIWMLDKGRLMYDNEAGNILQRNHRH